MRKKGGFRRWCPVLAVAALGVLPLSLSLERAAADTSTRGGAASQAATPGTPGGYERQTLLTGPGLPAHLNIPVLPPVTVDYRNDEGTIARMGGQAVSRGGSSESGTGSVAAVPTLCRNSAQCNDCNPCTLDACAVATCAGGVRDGFSCTVDSTDECGGVCAGGTRAGKGCDTDIDCCGDGMAIGNGTCTPFPCNTLTDFFCVNAVIPDVCKGGTNDRLACTGAIDCPGGTCDPQFVAGAECDDGLECNGQETCGAGACIAATAPLCAAGEVCIEANNECAAPCTTDAECETDGNKCTVDKCDLSTGLCFVDPVGLCGPAASCLVSAKHCSVTNDACTVNADCPTGTGTCVAGEVTICGKGRCCSGTGSCSLTTFAGCAAGSTWLSTETACGQIGTTGVIDSCPIYGAGLAPAGVATVEIPITTPNACGGTLDRIGDVYSSEGATGTGFISVNMVRFVHSAQVSARIAVEFWDISDPANPILIEDTFVPNGQNTGVHGPLVRTAVLDPPLVVPDSGVVAFSIAANFSPSGVASILTTDASDVGMADPAQMFVGTSLVADFAGQCTGGDRDGLFCDRRNADADCAGTVSGTCTDIPDILAFELVADAAATAPIGGCCDVGVGTCLQEIEWKCVAQGNTFRGAGVNCAVCIAGTNDGTACNDDTACTGGGICTEAVCELNPSTPCLLDSDCIAAGDSCKLIAQCTLQACCNDTSGACSVVTGLASTCPVGTTSRGFATSCEPDACPQPVDKSADNCVLSGLTPEVVIVPAPGDPLVSATMTGSNVPASFDDWNTGLCVDANGVSTGVACDPNAVDPDLPCTAPNTCSRLCPSGIFNPQGGTRDPGWWVSFSIDKFADVRIDNCESSPLVRPAWGFLDAGCPCQNFLANAGVLAPLGTGVGTPGGARGGPFCSNDDNFWQTYRNLPPGVYNYPVYSAPQSDIFPPVVGGVGGTFQFHVTVQAAEIAACCLPQQLCVRTDKSIDGIATDGSGTPVPCVTDADCAVGSLCKFCAEDIQPNCDLALGSWLSAPITPASVCEGGTNNGQLDCIDDGDCPGGVCRTVGTSFSCGIAPDGSDSPCNTGACCQGAGACDDRLPGDIGPMDRATCDSSNGTFFGGAKCEFPTPPCPVCTIASIPGNCQDGNGGFIFQMDRRIGFGGRKVADDFIASVTSIGQFCFSPCFIRAGDQGTNIGECSDLDRDGFAPPPDDYVVRFFEDAGGFPGLELASSVSGAGPVTIAAKRWQGGNSRCWDYSVVFSPALDGFVQGTRYWVEFSGSGDELPPIGDGCRVYLLNSLDGNLYSLQETDSFGDIAWTNEDNTALLSDFSFCIEGGLTAPPPVVGACCRPCGTTATCTDAVPWEDCVTSSTVEPGGAGNGINLLHQGDGFFFANQECIEIQCVATGSAGGGCPGAASGIPGEDCINPVAVTLEPQIPQEFTVKTLCSTTDGRGTFTTGDCGLGGSFVQDKWFEFTSNCDGRVEFDFCGDADYDTVIAVYSTRVPGPCPPAGAQGCEPDESFLVGGTCIDVACPVVKTGRPTFQSTTLPGTCYLVRVGGDDDAGTMQLEANCSTEQCPPSATPLDDLVANATGGMVQSTKSRFLSFEIAPDLVNPGTLTAVRVTMVDLWGAFSVFKNTVKWVGAPTAASEASGNPINDSTAPTFLAAQLVDAPVFLDWGSLGVVHVHDELIIPSRQLPQQPFEPATYWIQAVHEGCDNTAPDSFSNPRVVTQAQWADIGFLAGGQFVAPNGEVDVSDTLAILGKFANTANAPIKARAELLGVTTGPVAPIDGVISVSDLLAVLSAFSGDPYPFAPPALPRSAPNAVKAVTSR